MDTFTAIASLFGIAAVLSFINDRFLHLQQDIGLLLLAVLTTLGGQTPGLSGAERGATAQLTQFTQTFNLNDPLLKGVLCFLLFRGSVRVS